MTIEFRCEKCAARYKVKDDLSGRKTTCRKCQAEITIPYPPLELPDEVTTGGSVVYRHEAGTRDLQPASGNNESIERISDHIEQHLGPVSNVFHEVVSDLVHVDIHCVAPSEDRPWHTLVTSGMSDLPMSPPEGLEEFRHAELMISLPPDWPLDNDSFADPNKYWPVKWLKTLARFPHEYQTWLFEGHTVPNGDPPEPLATDTDFCGWLLFPAILAPTEFFELKESADKTIYFFAIYPLYQAEMELKLNRGTESLLERFAKRGVTELLDIRRKDVSKRGFWPFS